MTAARSFHIVTPDTTCSQCALMLKDICCLGIEFRLRKDEAFVHSPQPPITLFLGLTLELLFSGPKRHSWESSVEKSTCSGQSETTLKSWRGGFAIPRFLISPARASASISGWRYVEAVLFLRHYCTFQRRPRIYPRQIHQVILELFACKFGQSVVSGKPQSRFYPGPGGGC